jgi:hypothetical protein
MEWGVVDVGAVAFGAALGALLVGFDVLPSLSAEPLNYRPPEAEEVVPVVPDLSRACASAEASVLDQLREVQASLDELMLYEAIAVGESFEVAGASEPWTDGPPPLLQGGVFTAQLVGALALSGGENADIRALDCREVPCVVVLRDGPGRSNGAKSVEAALAERMEQVGYHVFERELVYGDGVVSLAYVPGEEGTSSWEPRQVARLALRQARAVASCAGEATP